MIRADVPGCGGALRLDPSGPVSHYLIAELVQ